MFVFRDLHKTIECGNKKPLVLIFGEKVGVGSLCELTVSLGLVSLA